MGKYLLHILLLRHLDEPQLFCGFYNAVGISATGVCTGNFANLGSHRDGSASRALSTKPLLIPVNRLICLTASPFAFRDFNNIVFLLVSISWIFVTLLCASVSTIIAIVSASLRRAALCVSSRQDMSSKIL